MSTNIDSLSILLVERFSKAVESQVKILSVNHNLPGERLRRYAACLAQQSLTLSIATSSPDVGAEGFSYVYEQTERVINELGQRLDEALNEGHKNA